MAMLLPPGYGVMFTLPCYLKACHSPDTPFVCLTVASPVCITHVIYKIFKQPILL